MKKQDLDALGELYSSVYVEKFLLERRQALPGQSQSEIDRQEAERPRQASAQRARLGVQKVDGKWVNLGVSDQAVGSNPWWQVWNKKGATAERKAKQEALAKSLADRLNKEEGRDKPKPTRTPVPGTQPAGSPPARPSGSSSTPPPRPTASGPVLSKKNGVEGTGIGANFKPRAFTDAEKSRYASVAAQNAARTSASSGSSPSSSSSSSTSSASAPKPPTPAIGKLGSTSFERRTPTSAELRAAQGERERQKASRQDTSSVANAEKALQAAQKTNLPTTGPSVDLATARSSVAADLAKFTPRDMNKYPIKPNPINNKKPIPEMKEQSQEWPSAKTIRDIADAYASIYEAKKNDGNLANNYPPYDKVTRGDVIAGRLGKDEMGGKKKSTKKEDFELWIDSLLDEGYDLSDYTWDDMYEIYKQQLNEATRMRKELGKEGETRVRGELAARSRAYQRSGSVDKTIAAAERAADRTTPRGRNESPGEYKQRMQQRSRTLRGLAASRRGSVRDKPRAGMRGYAAKVEGPDKDLQTARQRAMSAGTLTPKEKKQLGEEYQIYEIVASYLLENNFAETLNDANVIIENMSEVWLEEILNNN